MIATLLTLILAQDMTAKPVQEHALLKKFEGEWDSVAKFMMEPGKEPVPAKGKESCKLIMGGLFLVTSVDSEMFGGKFFGHGVLGYDIQKKKYTGSWVDSLNTAIYRVEGALEGNVLTERLESTEPETGAPLKLRLVHELKDADHRTMRVFVTMPDGNEVETGSIAYTRRK
ncbi:MAG TPA: DUF1579 domain-containing protein [Planctomycetota bacterium]